MAACLHILNLRSRVRLESGRRRVAAVGDRGNGAHVPRAHGSLGKAQGQSLDLVIVDLSLPGLDLGELIAGLRALPNSPRTIVGFAPHVHEAALLAAQQAGCDVVMSRGQFNAQLDELLGHYVARTV